MTDIFLFAAFPYIAVVVAVWAAVARYRQRRFSYSSLSSELLEKRSLFWGSVTWHYGIILILSAHVLAALFPQLWAAVIASPVRLYVLEVTGLALALMSLLGLTVLLVRRMTNARAHAVTSVMDWVLLLALFVQVALGFWVALVYRWGSDWYLHTAVPWLYSLLLLRPQTQFVIALPWVVKLHMLGGFVIVLLFPFTRLVHLVTFPFWYLWRPYQLVIWNRDSRRT